MRASSPRLASALASRLDSKVPDDIVVRADGTNVIVVHGDREFGASGATQIVDDEDGRSLAERVETVVRAVLSGVQDCVVEELTEPWPTNGSGGLAFPGARVVGHEVRSWYGEEQAPAMRLGTISFEEFVDRAE